MSAASFSSVCRAIKRGDLAPVYYLTGDEEILKDELIGAVINAAVEETARDFNLDVRTEGDLNGESLHALVETPPMLAARRVAVVKGTEQWRKNSKVWHLLRLIFVLPTTAYFEAFQLVLLITLKESTEACQLGF